MHPTVCVCVCEMSFFFSIINISSLYKNRFNYINIKKKLLKKSKVSFSVNTKMA